MDLELVETPESDAKALSDRELQEAIYVMLRRVTTFTDMITAAADGMKDNPMLSMILGGKKK